MPQFHCPTCGRDISFPDYFHGTVIACPATTCGRPVQLPYADGSMPNPQADPPPSAKPQPADKYFLRRPTERDIVVGPLPRAKLRQLAVKEQFQPFDELSVDGQTWHAAFRIDPGLFRTEEDPTCPTCGALLKGSDTQCRGCAKRDPSTERAAGAYSVSSAKVGLHAGKVNPLVERKITAPHPLDDIGCAHGADAVVGVCDGGWLGLWRVSDGKGLRTWEFEPGRRAHLVVAEHGDRAILADEHKRCTRLYLAEFEYRKLNELIELDGHIETMMFSRDGKELTLVTDVPEVRVYRVNPWKRLDRFPIEGERFAISPIGDRLAAAHSNGEVFLWDLHKGKLIQEVFEKGHRACPQLPLRMAFSRNGKRLFTASGIVVRFVDKHFDGIDAFTAFLFFGSVGYILNNNAKLILDSVRPNDAELRRRLERNTTVRVWNVSDGRLADELGDAVLVKYPTGIVDAVYCPFSSAAVTIGPASAHAWDMATGNSLGPLYQLASEADAKRAAEHVDPARAALRGHPSLIRRVDFSKDGEYALVLVCGSGDIQVVRWPQ